MVKPNFVFVLDTNRCPLAPCSPARARELLKKGKAAVFRRYPFTIILKREVEADPEGCQLKLDPGSKTTGIALLSGEKVIWAAELTHRGAQIKQRLESRRALRRGRRNRLHYRHPSFRTKAQINNAKRGFAIRKGRLPPSLQHRVETTLTWVNRILRLAPVQEITQELVRFDMQLMDNPDIGGVQYQQGTLAGYEVREYLLEKWNRTCAYCGKKDVPLQIEHIHPKAGGGSNRISNLTLACEPCNKKKGRRPVEEFLKKKPEVLKRIQTQAKRPLKDAAAVNSTRWALFRRLDRVCDAVTVGSGGETKYNRQRFEIPKSHWADAACVGTMEAITLCTEQPLLITCKGQGGRQKAVVDKYGYPKQHRSLKPIHGWRSGDIAKCDGKIGRISPRQTGSFEMRAFDGGKPFSRPKDKFVPVHRNDGYQYGLPKT